MPENRVVRIMHPPGEYKWTMDRREAAGQDPDYYYLPQAVMHEMGHTLGIGHIPWERRYSIMSGGSPRGWPLSTLQNADKEALDLVLSGQHP